MDIVVSYKPQSTSDRQIRAELASEEEGLARDTSGSTIIAPPETPAATRADLTEAVVLLAMVVANTVIVLILFANTSVTAGLWTDGMVFGFLLAMGSRATMRVRRALR